MEGVLSHEVRSHEVLGSVIDEPRIRVPSDSDQKPILPTDSERSFSAFAEGDLKSGASLSRPPSPRPDRGAPARPLLTVDQFMRTMLAAALETPVARNELAAIFLAASAAWEVTVRAQGWRRAALHPDAAEQRALACFCTHHGHSCRACARGDIEGARFLCVTCARSTSMYSWSFCSRCRRGGAKCPRCDPDECRFAVFEHPWESDLEYNPSAGVVSQDVFKVPRAPLNLGDTGPRVMHLQYVLYKMGYLRLCDSALCVGVFCEATRETIYRFQRDHNLVSAGSLPAGQVGCLAAVSSSSKVGTFSPVVVPSVKSVLPQPFSPLPQTLVSTGNSIYIDGVMVGTSSCEGPGACHSLYVHSDQTADLPVASTRPSPHPRSPPLGPLPSQHQNATFETPTSKSTNRDLPGVFTSVTRSHILNLFRDVEMRYSEMHCRYNNTPSGHHMRLATAA